MVIKISCGSFKGKTLASTNEARQLRPTQSLLREAIVSMVNNFFDEDSFSKIKMLDLYAGIGSVGFEFLSCGIDYLTCVERDPKCIKLLRQNSIELDVKNKTRIVPASVSSALKKLAGSRFDLIFLDPPYKLELRKTAELLENLLKIKMLNDNALVIFETELSGSACHELMIDSFENKKKKKFKPQIKAANKSETDEGEYCDNPLYQMGLRLLKLKKYGSSFLAMYKKI